MEARFTPTYKDKFFILLFIPIGVINIYIAYGEFLLNRRFLFGLLLDTFEVTCAWLAVRYIIRRLDEQYPYQKNVLKRILLQLVLTTVASLSILIFLTEGINYLLTDKPVPREVYTHHLWVFEIWLLVLNGIYITMYFWQWSGYLESRKPKPDIPRATLLTKLAGRSTVLNLSDIRYCTVSDDLTIIGTTNGEIHLVEKSLEQLEQLLPPDYFFRANRQYIIHRELVKSIERIENGRIAILLHPFTKLPEAITMSRTKAPAFREWLKLAVA
ncbi:LytTR family DNA-binding domain-containing protein [Telluribacter sp. SYSU D00476]|uniref:LytTR family DNA-binding domain-containing protein n=1 Tax=Telluribacter sp. SYSU D00476 TaxID=2811430 RepID=UPI001FF2C065|nr:LytTR family DNA-binding domain-containing protein [Telluribacter sp. SYSU D00476]